ncbi:MAG: NADPH-dependent 7-cyano-7-deazaguanine reductase QueF [Ruminobacter sp.]|uniref:NADPH-dependent 7-cyano-7-deazaguanine reductase QueF n=1 Tax=Ruminobacter sp. TaxID=2774296 RepID=UPI001B294803|nr:NADPH-dependent 7-cyano-7-deazaguanine reductase QueF [Ruminobacter sp.]MBO6009069.1 NADPH-dependent 7-cyano-7-deazaguanine reductase QueF [Ruminobacter sp.]MBP3748406.1 NADPH-dependent 7-cyano-7-deazaguanine reductase QueF [Ruminobacter sp.]
MISENISELSKNLVLGKKTAYETRYNADLLQTVPRSLNRNTLNISTPFYGYDVWHHYEISYLNFRGRPEVAVGVIYVPADSECIIESKSLKLYFNSFNMTKFLNINAVKSTVENDLSRALGTTVTVELFRPSDTPQSFEFGRLDAVNLDELDIEVSQYTLHPDFIVQEKSGEVVTEALKSDLLKSNCLITGQPDWGTIYVKYTGKKINHEGLLQYIISMRTHNEFHEHCVERIFTDIANRCDVSYLEVRAFYTRRGGLDINPVRATHELPYDSLRLIRQ